MSMMETTGVIDTNDASTDALLGSLLGAGRGVGELAEVVVQLARRLRQAELASAAQRAQTSGVAPAAATAKRAAALQERLETGDARLAALEAIARTQEGLLVAVQTRAVGVSDAVYDVGNQIRVIEAGVSKLQEHASGVASVAALDAVAQRVASLEGVEVGQRLRHLETAVDGLDTDVLDARTRITRVDDASTGLGRRVQGAETRLAETRQQAAGLAFEVAALTKAAGRIDELSHGLDAAEGRLAVVEADSVLHARSIGSVWESLTGLPERIAVTESRLMALATDVSAQAAQAADARLTVRGLADTVAAQGERLDGTVEVLRTYAAQVADGGRATDEGAERVAALGGRLEELAGAVEAHAQHVAALESTVKLLVDASGQTPADDPKLRYMRHTGAPHAPDLYPVQGSQFQQDGVTKVVWRCRHCDYRQSQPVAGA